ncbi:preprotein translocase subunit SecG [Acidomonas methanolica]|uniref:Protein-export membrane protein SecG n=1 Tax=Acidomonas methanolica NBRC 104435 TaxID=1231351 RepID=A0A023D1P3_ACIMT|nr:preprotein translocase subunit SecG [Acidomonas methanolica]MBU2653390.1 preprotein translocase subunit SecG [Acidomonas methanolica]MCQ9154380.1 preprotein translocase subunit SecG [Acidomonas methanolica]TCS32341.1 preprotein translocase subunit SecG [Acidomonas methanolica]GAJ27716.1 protein translocase subunit SecG [Acidomonas methanolica NBRC 104435]GBQ58581.1 protein translocase subunit SecG [Acidomonas methanolica]
MTTVLLILNLFVTIALIAVVLVQRSEGGGFGIGSSQGMGSFMTGRGTATLLTRTTSVLAAVFMLLCLLLAVLNRGASTGTDGHDILAQPPAPGTTAPAPAKTTTPPPPASPAH